MFSFLLWVQLLYIKKKQQQTKTEKTKNQAALQTTKARSGGAVGGLVGYMSWPFSGLTLQCLEMTSARQWLLYIGRQEGSQKQGEGKHSQKSHVAKGGNLMTLNATLFCV